MNEELTRRRGGAEGERKHKRAKRGKPSNCQTAELANSKGAGGWKEGGGWMGFGGWEDLRLMGGRKTGRVGATRED